MCFPHVDEDTRDVLQSLMTEADCYREFTEKLCDYVCTKSASPLLAYFAVLFPFYINYYSLIYKLEAFGKVSELAEPLFLFTRPPNAPPLEWQKMRNSILNALEVAPNDWIACQLYLVWRYWAEQVFPEADVDIRPLEAIAARADTSVNFAYFKWYLLIFKTWQYMRETKRDLAVETLKQALAIARKYDEQISVADTLCVLAGHVKHTNVNKAIELFSVSKDICERLGYHAGIGQVQHHLGLIMGFRGEFDAAIEYQQKYIEIAESLGHRTELQKSIIAHFYNQIKEGEKAYELAIPMVELGQTSIRYNAFPQANLAWAHINLGNYDVAREELDIARDFGIKSGTEAQMMWVHLVEGLLDKAEANYDSAIVAFEEVLAHLVEDPTPAITNICYLNLTEIEIDTLAEEHLVRKSEFSGPWMELLFEHIEENDLPGIRGQAILLLAKLRQRQGKDEEVRKLLQEVHRLANSSSMKYLDNLAITMFPDIVLS